MKKKLLIAGIGLAVLCLIAAGLFFWLGAEESTSVRLGWNPDFKALEAGQMTRVADEKGYFTFRLWVDGQEVTYRTDDAELMTQLDAQQVVQIEADRDGNIKKVSAPQKTELANRDLVQQVSDDRLLLNSSIAFNGSQKELVFGKNCKITDVSGTTCAPATLQTMDEVLAYGNEKGEITHIFLLHRQLPAKLCWRLERKYDSKTKGTSRQPDENGVYTILFAVDGGQTEMKCKEKALVDQIDEPGTNAAAMGIAVDEEGYIIRVQEVYKTVRGKEVCSLYDVQQVEGNEFVAVNKQDGTTYGKSMEGQLAADCEIFNVSTGAVLKGERVETLQPGDRITAYGDAMGQVRYVFIHVRKVESRLYFNLERMYQNGDTTRQPDENGWYVFQMASDGQILTLRTRQHEVAKKIDSISSKGMGMELDGDVVLRAFGVDSVTGNGALVTGRYVKSITGAMVTTTSTYTGIKATPLMIHDDCVVYDVSQTAGDAMGAQTQLREGDRIYAYGTADEAATHIFVVQRAEETAQ